MGPLLPLQEVRGRRKTGSQDPQGPQPGSTARELGGALLPACWGSGSSRPAPTSTGARPQSSPLQRSCSLLRLKRGQRRLPSRAAQPPSHSPRASGTRGPGLRPGGRDLWGRAPRTPWLLPSSQQPPASPGGHFGITKIPASLRRAQTWPPGRVPALGGCSLAVKLWAPLCPAHPPRRLSPAPPRLITLCQR